MMEVAQGALSLARPDGGGRAPLRAWDAADELALAHLAELGIADGAIVDLVSEWADQRERRAPKFRVVAYDIARRTCAAYFPEANVLVPLDSVADESNTPTSKAIVIRLEPA